MAREECYPHEAPGQAWSSWGSWPGGGGGVVAGKGGRCWGSWAGWGGGFVARQGELWASFDPKAQNQAICMPKHKIGTALHTPQEAAELEKGGGIGLFFFFFFFLLKKKKKTQVDLQGAVDKIYRDIVVRHPRDKIYI